MNHYAKGLIVLLVLSALSISGVYALDSSISMNTNGCSNSVSQSVPSGSAINQVIIGQSSALSGTVVINGPYSFSDTVINPEGDQAGVSAYVYLDPTNYPGPLYPTVGSHSWSSSITATVATYASALTVGNPQNPTTLWDGATTISNSAYGINAEFDSATAAMVASDFLGGARANMQKSFVMGGATSSGAFAWAQVDSMQGDDLLARTFSTGSLGLGVDETFAGMAVGGFDIWQTSPSIRGYQSFSVEANGQTVAASVLGSGTIDATNVLDFFGVNVNPDANVNVFAVSKKSGSSNLNINVPSGLISVDKAPMSFAYEDGGNTYSALAVTASGLSAADALATTGADGITITRSGSGFGNVDYNLIAYSGIADNSENAIVKKV